MNNPLEELQAIIDRATASKDSLTVLEAGCGSLSNITLGPNVYIVGLDVSAEQLARNRTVHQKIVADLETHALPDSEYDLIICWDVLEHLGQPLAVLRKFFNAIKQDGIIILAFPNVLSLKGLIAKYTPFRFHTLVSGWIYGDRVGSAGYEVCPTVLRYAIAPNAVARYAARHGCDVPFAAVFESGMQKRVRERCGLVKTRWWLFRALVRLLTFGWVDAEGSDCILVLRPSVSSIRLLPSSPRAS
jgi:SAM-dependent methyltransferase